MKHSALGPALSLIATVLFVTGSPSEASAADPSGIWAKDDGSAKVEIKKCGRGICSTIVWLRAPKDSQGKPLHDARNEDPSKRDRPIIGLPLFNNMPLTEPNTWIGNVYNPEEGHIYTDVKVTLVSPQQIVLKGCKTWLLCGEKIWTRSHLPPIPAAPEKPIEANAPAAGSPDKAEPRSAPKLQAPVVEAFRERNPLSAPGIAVVTTAGGGESLPLSGENVSSMIVMTGPSPGATPAETPLTGAAAAEEQDPPTPVRPLRPQPRAQKVAQSEAPAPAAASNVRKPKPKPVVREPQEQLPWRQHPLALLVSPRTRAQSEALAPAAAPVVREPREQLPWLQTRQLQAANTRFTQD
jgi:uncharacterized protein (DUF2147 family)